MSEGQVERFATLTPQIAEQMSDNELTQQLDNAPLSLFHLRAVILSGVGFFTDAYDLFVIGAVIVLLKQQWHLDGTMVGLVGSTTLIANFVGAFLFGRLADILGRKKLYGLVAMIMAVASILTAFAPSIGWLIAFRFLLGIGIGGDYPISAVLMSEYANVKDRGKLVSMVFSMQALGLIAGPIVAITLLGSGMSDNLVWRLMLGLGAIPALAVIWFRRKMPESPRFQADVLGQGQTAAEAMRTLSHKAINVKRTDTVAHRMTFRRFITNPRTLLTLVGTAGTWFMFDYAYYGNSISTQQILKLISPHASLLQMEAWTLIIFSIAAVPGYILAVLTVDRIGHRKLQLIGFAVMGLAFLSLGVIPGMTVAVIPFLLVYGVSYFFAEFGPNTTTFLLAAELYPASMRTTGHGISAGVAKVGAFIGVFVFPWLAHTFGLRGTLDVTFAFSTVGFLLTLLLPEAANKSLETIEDDTAAQAPNKLKSQVLKRA